MPTPKKRLTAFALGILYVLPIAVPLALTACEHKVTDRDQPVIIYTGSPIDPGGYSTTYPFTKTECDCL